MQVINGRAEKARRARALVDGFEGADDGEVVLEFDRHFLFGQRLEYAEDEHRARARYAEARRGRRGE